MNPKNYIFDNESDEARLALLHGYVRDGGQRVRVIATEVLQEGPASRKVVFSPANGSLPSLLTRYLSSLRAISLTATALPGFAVLLLGLAQGAGLNSTHFVLALMGAVLFQVAVNVQNDVEDHLKLIDLPGGPGGSGVIQRGWLTARELQIFAYASLALGVLCGLPVVMSHPKILGLVALVGLIGTLGYSGWPLGLKYKALGDINVFLLCGPVLSAGFSVAAFGQILPGSLLVGSYFGLLACGLLHVNNMQDINYDQSRGARTLAGVLGFSRSRQVLLAFYVLAYLALGVGVGLSSVYAGSLLALLAVPVIASLLRRTWQASGPDSPRMNGLRILAAQLHLLCGLLFCAGYLLSHWLGD